MSQITEQLHAPGDFRGRPPAHCPVSNLKRGTGGFTPLPELLAKGAFRLAAHGSDVVETIVNGKVLRKDRKLLTLDVSKVVAKAEKAAKTLTTG